MSSFNYGWRASTADNRSSRYGRGQYVKPGTEKPCGACDRTGITSLGTECRRCLGRGYNCSVVNDDYGSAVNAGYKKMLKERQR